MINKFNPTTATIASWLKRLDPAILKEQGWIEIRKSYPEITKAAPTFIHKHFKEGNEREAAYDGFTMALLTLAHFDDIQRLHALFTQTASSREEDPDFNP